MCVAAAEFRGGPSGFSIHFYQVLYPGMHRAHYRIHGRLYYPRNVDERNLTLQELSNGDFVRSVQYRRRGSAGSNGVVRQCETWKAVQVRLLKLQ